MVEEHRDIKRMLAVIRKYCYKVLKNTLEALDLACEKFEQEAKDNKLQQKYLDMIAEFEGKV